MDFSNRSTQQTQASHPSTPLSQSSLSSKLTGRGPRGDSKWWRLGSVGLLFGIVVLVVAIIGLLYLGGPNEGRFIKSDKYQAIFLTNGQVYFGHIKDINNSFINLQNVYYLQSSNANGSSSSSSTSNNVTLIKLGCELHAPYDQLIINRAQVSFWENIQDNGQVGKGIAQLKTCTQSSSTTQSTNNAQSSTQNPSSPATKP